MMLRPKFGQNFAQDKLIFKNKDRNEPEKVQCGIFFSYAQYIYCVNAH